MLIAIFSVPEASLEQANLDAAEDSKVLVLEALFFDVPFSLNQAQTDHRFSSPASRPLFFV